MPDELKRDVAPACLPVTRSRAARSERSGSLFDEKSAAFAPAALEEVGWFEAIGPEPAPPPPRRSYAAIPLAAIAIALAIFGRGAILRVALPVALGVAAVVFLVISVQRAAAAKRAKRLRGLGLEIHEGKRSSGPDSASPIAIAAADGRSGSFSIDADLPAGRLLFKVPGSAAAQTLLCTSEPFGVTLLCTPRRDRAVAMLTSPTGTFCVGAHFDGQSRRLFSGLFDRAFTVMRDESGLDAIGPDGEPILLPPDAFASLINALTRVDVGCLDRLVLTDAHGAPLLLNARELRVGDRVFDLEAPLEWRGLMFQEGFGQAIAVYQGTWIRQNGTEIVLVSLLPSLASAGPLSITEGSPLASLERGVLRDLRLMQATPEAPPPNEQRVAIERLFMLPLRNALDRAPRPVKQPTRVRA